MNSKTPHSNISQNVKILAYVAFVIIFMVGGFILGLYVQENRYTNFVKSFKNIRENSDKYTFINPLIGGISAPATDVGIFNETKDDIESYLKQEERLGNLYDHSFYFRDMNTGLWFGSNESADFFPASLFKLPIAISVYKQAEDDPSFLKKIVTYTSDIQKANESIQTNSESNLVIGKQYSVEELVETMLVFSDNGAKNLLLSSMDISYLNQLFSIVALVDPSSIKNYQISSRKYALFFRILYGSSYLNEEHSEFILKLLSKTTFKDGMMSSIPAEVSASHKYGVYEIEENIKGINRKAQELHDCGIVYHFQRPYIFCLMTKGRDIESLFRIFSKTSKIIYDSQEKQF